MSVFYILPLNAIGLQEEEILNSRKNRIRLLGIAEGIIALLISYVIFATLYTSEIYPKLSRAWGGGKPIPITICLAKETIPDIDIMKKTLPHAKISESENTLSIASVYLVHSTNKESVIVDQIDQKDKKPSGMAVPNDRIQLITWVKTSNCHLFTDTETGYYP